MFRIKRNTKLKKLMNAYCVKKCEMIHPLALWFLGRPILLDDTPDKLNMEDGDEIDAIWRIPGPPFLAYSYWQPVIDLSGISLTVKDQNNNKTLFRIKRSTQFKKLMNVYCERKSVEFNSFVFLFEGRRLRADQTLDELEMEDGDEIHAMWRIHGLQNSQAEADWQPQGVTNDTMAAVGLPSGGDVSHIFLKVNCQEGNKVIFGIKRSTQFKKLMNAYCFHQFVDFESVYFSFNGKLLPAEQTSDELVMEDGDEIDAFPRHVGNYNQRQSEMEYGLSNRGGITLIFQHGVIKLLNNIKDFFRIKRNTQFKKLMNAYCERRPVKFNSLAFLFEGRRLHAEQTPDEFEMEDGDEIHTMWRIHGLQKWVCSF